MPSISTTLSPALSAQWREYFALVDRLREFAVWRHEEDGELRPSGLQRPPRFVAVMENAAQFARFQEQAGAVADLPTKWPVQLFDEVWGWGRVSVGSGSHSQRLAAGLPTDLGEVKRQDLAQVVEVVAALEAAGHSVLVADNRLMVTPGPDGLTIRRRGGRAFRLSIWNEQGEPLHKLSVGAVVCRGIQQGVHEGGGPRKSRSDALRKIAAWDGVSFYGRS